MNRKAKPFIKWVGGKTQLLNSINKLLPEDNTTVFSYVEPFVGGGAVLFHVLNTYHNLRHVIINDINIDLINTYKTIKQSHEDLLIVLLELQNEFHLLEDNDEGKKQYYNEKRSIFNSRKENIIYQSALFIFLNKTCFNGLFRVNKKNQFNVPMGKYKSPTICDYENICNVHKVLQRVEIFNIDYENILNYSDSSSLFYIDPPYKPISKTSNFTSYSTNDFNDNEQIRLKNFCIKLDKLGHKFIVSNSDNKLFF